MTQLLHHTTLTAKAKYRIKQSGKIFLLSLNRNGSNSFSFANAKNLYQFKTKDSEIKRYSLCLGNVSEDFTVNSTKIHD